MKKNTIYWIIGALATYWILKKKGIIGENTMDKAEALTAEEVNKLDLKIDYRDFGDIYRKEQKDMQCNNI